MKNLTRIEVAERRLRLPPGWLRVQAAADRIPHLRADEQIWVHLPTLRRFLTAVAKGAASEATPETTPASVSQADESEGEQ